MGDAAISPDRPRVRASTLKRPKRRGIRTAPSVLMPRFSLFDWIAKMPLINVVLVLIVVGVLLWLVNTYIPMDGKIKQILNAVVVIAVVIWLLQAFGLIGSLSSIRIGK